MVRSGGSRRGKGGGGKGRFFSGPVGAVIIGVLLILGLGYAVKNYKPADEPAAGKVTAPEAGAPKATTPATGNTTPAAGTNTPAAPVASTPAPQPEQQAAAQRSHIDRSGGAASKDTVTIYYADALKGGESLQPVEVQIAVPANGAWIRTVADQVVNPPRELKLESGIPAGTTVKSVNFLRESGTAVIDLSAEAKGVSSASDASTIKAAFVYSLTELKDVKAVLVRINGFTAQFGQMVWDKPISRAELTAQNVFRVEPVIKFQ